MKIILLLCTSLVLTAFSNKSYADRPLEGCSDPNAIAAMLTRIRDSNGQDVTLEQLRSIWRKELSDLECNSNKSRSLRSEDRIINGQCQCCATFSFTVRQTQDGAKSEKLDGVIVNYSAHRRDELVRIAKRFASASGLRQAELNRVGLDSKQSFHWQTTKAKDRNLYTIELHFINQGRLWQLYFNSGWNTIE